MSCCCQSNKTWKPSTCWNWSRFLYSFAEWYLKIELENTFFLYGQHFLDKANIFFYLNIYIQVLFLVVVTLLNNLKHNSVVLHFCSDGLFNYFHFILKHRKIVRSSKKGGNHLQDIQDGFRKKKKCNLSLTVFEFSTYKVRKIYTGLLWINVALPYFKDDL